MMLIPPIEFDRHGFETRRSIIRRGRWTAFYGVAIVVVGVLASLMVLGALR